MCPLRFILVFFSALLAGYFAWRTVRSSPEIDPSLQETTAAAAADADDTAPRKGARELNFKKGVQDGFWVFVDMASGRYLWRNFKEMRAPEKAKNC